MTFSVPFAYLDEKHINNVVCALELWLYFSDVSPIIKQWKEVDEVEEERDKQL